MFSRHFCFSLCFPAVYICVLQLVPVQLATLRHSSAPDADAGAAAGAGAGAAAAAAHVMLQLHSSKAPARVHHDTAVEVRCSHFELKFLCCALV